MTVNYRDTMCKGNLVKATGWVELYCGGDQIKKVGRKSTYIADDKTSKKMERARFSKKEWCESLCDA